MDWSDVRIFLAVARVGTLSGAAQRLGLTQPTVGRRLRALEAATRQTLFQRGREGFQLTDEGLAVLAHAQRMEDEALAFERRLAGSAQSLQGRLRISASDWFGAEVLTPICAAFMQAHPQVELELLTDARLFDLARREADLVFRIRRLDDPEIVQRTCMHLDYALYGPEGARPPEAGDGAGATLISLDAAFEELPDMVWLKKTFPHARRTFGSNSRQAQARMCALGAGFAVLPVPLGERTAGLQRHPLPSEPPGRDVWLAYHQDLRELPRLRAFLEIALARLQPSGA